MTMVSTLAATYHPSIKLSAKRIPFCTTPIKSCNFSSLTTTTLPLTRNFGGFGLLIVKSSTNSISVQGEEEEVNSSRSKDDDAEMAAARGDSTMPERFRYLTKEAPDPPVRWPYFIGTLFLSFHFLSAYFYLSFLFELFLRGCLHTHN